MKAVYREKPGEVKATVTEKPVMTHGQMYLQVALSFRKERFGFLIIADPLEGNFGERDHELLAAIGTQLSIGLEDAFLY